MPHSWSKTVNDAQAQFVERDTYDEPGAGGCTVQSSVQGRAADIIPVTRYHAGSRHICILLESLDSHVDGSFFGQSLNCILRLVVERDIGTNALHECDLLVRAGRSDDLQPFLLRNLNNSRADRTYGELSLSVMT